MSSKSKGNILESITEILERSLSNELTVITKNKKIEDLDGIVREIDIYVETLVNKRKFNIAIECKHYDEKSRIDMDKIGAFYEKCSRLPFISKMIFLTTSDYQKGAIKKARTRNIDLYKIIKDKFDKAEGNQLGIDNISIIEKKCKILGVRFNSKKLFQSKIYKDEKLQFFHQNKELIHPQFFQEKLIELPEIWKFLFTKSGMILNQKKIIYPNIITTNVYTKYGDVYYPVDTMQFTLEIEYRLNQLEFKDLKKYHSLTEDLTIATFSDLEFIVNGVKHRFCYVKPTDENEGRFFVSTQEEESSIELKTIAMFTNNPISISSDNQLNIRNIKVIPYEFNLSKKAIDNSMSNIEIKPKGNNSEFLKKIKSKKSSIMFGIDENNRKLFFMIPFSHNEKLITAKFPEPISLYYSHSVELYKKSLKYKDMMASNSEGEDDDNSIIMQDGSYHKFLQYNISSILMLHSAIELFINSCIKDDYKIELDGKLLNKKEIEDELTLVDKLEKIVPQISDFNFKSNKKILYDLLDLNELNEDLQNLKTSDSINQPFLHTFENLLKFKMEDCFESVKILFKKVNKNYKLIEE